MSFFFDIQHCWLNTDSRLALATLHSFRFWHVCKSFCYLFELGSSALVALVTVRAREHTTSTIQCDRNQHHTLNTHTHRHAQEKWSEIVNHLDKWWIIAFQIILMYIYFCSNIFSNIIQLFPFVHFLHRLPTSERNASTGNNRSRSSGLSKSSRASVRICDDRCWLAVGQMV